MILSVLLILPLTILANGCPELKYPECDEKSMYCWGGHNAAGCEMAGVCIPFHNGMIGDDGTECWSSCPMTCAETEVSCPYAFYNGCPTGDYCMPKDTGCPIVCPPITGAECGPHEMMCAGGIDSATGCEKPDHCIPDHNGMTGDDGTECWIECPPICTETEKICPGDFYNGCPMGDYCMPKDTECPIVCPPITGAECGPDERMCPGGIDFATGCETPGQCMPYHNGMIGTDGTECGTHCPITCADTEFEYLYI